MIPLAIQSGSIHVVPGQVQRLHTTLHHRGQELADRLRGRCEWNVAIGDDRARHVQRWLD